MEESVLKFKIKKYFPYTVYTTLTAAVAIFIVISCTNQSAKAKTNFIFKDPPKEGIVAKIAGQDVTMDELIGDAKLTYIDLQKRIFEFKMERLNELIEERLIGAEAKKANLSKDEFIGKNITKGKTEITEKEFKDFVKDKKIPENQLNPQLKERINVYLKDKKEKDLVQKYLAGLTGKNAIEVYFTKPKMNVAVDIGDAPKWGNNNAPVTMVIFSDFQCPFCGRAAATVDELKKKYKGKMQIAFKQFPLSFHKEARPAAEASLCVNDQGSDKFWKFHDLAFKTQQKLDTSGLETLAKQAGVDLTKFKQCVDSKKFNATVQADLEYGEKLGVRSTPTFFINGEVVSGAMPVDQFSEVIEEAITTGKN